MFNNGDIVSVNVNGRGANGVTLRNVAPPKPEPVLWESWLLLTRDGVVVAHADEYEADEQMTANAAGFHTFVEKRTITWMSDGSPVAEATTAPGEDVTSATVEARAEKAEAALAHAESDYKRMGDELQEVVSRSCERQMRLKKAEAERDKFRSIVALAHDWAFSSGTRVLRDPYELNLFDEVTMLGEDNRPQRKGYDDVNPELLKAIRENRLENQLDRLRQEHEKSEARIANMKAEFHDSLEWDELIAERNQWKTQCEQWAAKATEWALERERLKAVVDAAVAWGSLVDDKGCHAFLVPQAQHLYSSVRAAKTEGLVEASLTSLGIMPQKTAEDAVANVAKMMGVWNVPV